MFGRYSWPFFSYFLYERVYFSFSESSKEEEVTKVEVIETKPIETTVESVEEIRPSKTLVEQKSTEKKNAYNKKSQDVKKVVSSVFAVVSSPFVEEVTEEKKEEPSRKEEIKETRNEESKVIKEENIVIKEEKVEQPEKKEEAVEKKKPVVFTKVEIREGPTEEKIVKVPKFTTVESVKESVSEDKKTVIVKPEKRAPVITTRVEVKTTESVSDSKPDNAEEKELVNDVHVEIVEHNENEHEEKTVTEAESEAPEEVTGILKPLAILSSKVEVIAEEPATIIGNNIGETSEYYDFLSRQPSEVVDETFRVSLPFKILAIK